MGTLADTIAADPGLLALLEPGEAVVAVLPQVDRALTGVERISEPPPPAEPEGRPLGPLGSVAGAAVVVGAAALAPTGWGGGDLPLRLLGGTSVAGDRGSLAVRLFDALGAVRAARRAVVTDRRLLFVEERSATWAKDDSGTRVRSAHYLLTAAVPLSALVSARRRGRPGARGRVELHFRDGSMLALMTGVLSTRPARRLLAALGVPAG